MLHIKTNDECLVTLPAKPESTCCYCIHISEFNNFTLKNLLDDLSKLNTKIDSVTDISHKVILD